MTQPYRLRAYNTATESENKIHDDEVASRLGFSGGLVPGVDVYAYLTHPVVERWGRDWLEHGTITARFSSPVYDGEEVEVTATDNVPDTLSVALRTGGGDLRAEATAGLRVAGEEALVPDVPASAMPARDERPPATMAVLSALDVLGTREVGFHADRHGEYLADVRDDLPIYTRERVAHPGWVLRQANYVLSDNVRLGPWIHVGSTVRNIGAVEDGARVHVRARVREVTERKGHEFVHLDVVMLVDGSPVAVVDHTAIFRPRGVPPVS